MLFEIRGNPIEAHIHELNPVDYAIASIIEAGLRVVEVSISPAKIIRHIMKAQQTGINFWLSVENLFEELVKHDPIKEIVNAISLFDNPLVPEKNVAMLLLNFPSKQVKYGMKVTIFLSALFFCYFQI